MNKSKRKNWFGLSMTTCYPLYLSVLVPILIIGYVIEFGKAIGGVAKEGWEDFREYRTVESYRKAKQQLRTIEERRIKRLKKMEEES